MQHDFETGMDYFYARYYSGAEGRFTGADLPLIDQYPSDPQSWNLYGYVRNSTLPRRSMWCRTGLRNCAAKCR